MCEGRRGLEKKTVRREYGVCVRGEEGEERVWCVCEGRRGYGVCVRGEEGEERVWCVCEGRRGYGVCV